MILEHGLKASGAAKVMQHGVCPCGESLRPAWVSHDVTPARIIVTARCTKCGVWIDLVGENIRIVPKKKAMSGCAGYQYRYDGVVVRRDPYFWRESCVKWN